MYEPLRLQFALEVRAQKLAALNEKLQTRVRSEEVAGNVVVSIEARYAERYYASQAEGVGMVPRDMMTERADDMAALVIEKIKKEVGSAFLHFDR